MSIRCNSQVHVFRLSNFVCLLFACRQSYEDIIYALAAWKLASYEFLKLVCDERNGL